MRLTFGFREVGHNFATLTKKAIEIKRSNLGVKVGVMEGGSEAAPGLTMAQLMAIHEFGAPRANIPERSAIRSTYHAEREALGKLSKAVVQRILKDQMTIEQGLGILGLDLATKIKRRITDGEGIPPPLSPVTIARKGSTRPLVDSGRLLGSITWTVAPREGSE